MAAGMWRSSPLLALSRIFVLITSVDGFSFLQSRAGVFRRSVHLAADRFGPPPPIEEPSILDVALPLMKAAKLLEKAGTTIVSFSGDDRGLFEGGTQLVNAARDVEDAGALGRMRPGLFAEEPTLKIRASGEAMREASTKLQVPFFGDCGAALEACGEELGRLDQRTSGAHLLEAGAKLVEASVKCRDLPMPEPAPLDEDGEEKGGWLSGLTNAWLPGGAQGDWGTASDDLFEAGKCLESSGKMLVSCRVAKRRF